MTTISRHLKRCTGVLLIGLCDAFPALKSRLRRYGLRTSKEWFGRRVVRVQRPDGASVRLAGVNQNYLSFELFWKGTGYYEPITTLVFEQLLRPGTTFLDVGANIGFYSLVLSAARSPVRVIAFEPNPRLFELLERNAQVNGLTQMTCEPLALSDRSGTAPFYLNQSDMSASLRSDFDAHRTRTIEVETTTLDRYVSRNLPRGELLIKVDVEGHEDAFFEGARQTLAFRKPDIIAEVAVNYGERTTQLLKDNGYRFYPITDQALSESPALVPVVREPLVFLNYLLSPRPKSDIAAVFGAIETQVKGLDLRHTSKCADFHALEQMKERQARQELPVSAQEPGISPHRA